MPEEIDYESSFCVNSKTTTHTIKRYVERHNLMPYQCAWCGLGRIYNGKPLTLQLDHINGNNTDNRIENLRYLCPNCHSQTDTYKGRNKTDKASFGSLSVETIVDALKQTSSINEALILLGFRTEPARYSLCKEIIERYQIIQPQKKISKVNEDKTITKVRASNCQCSVCGIPIKHGAKMCRDCYNKAQRIVIRPSREELKRLIRTNNFCEIGRQFNVSDNAIRKWCDDYSLPRNKTKIMKYSEEEWDKI